MNSRQSIREFIISEIIYPQGENGLKDSDPLLESGILDSLNMIKLLAFLEEKFAVQVTDEDLMPDNFKTIEAISNLVDSKNPNAA